MEQHSGQSAAVFFDTDLPRLKDVLLRHYLMPAASWLLGPPDSPYLLPQSANSSWECALAIWHLLDLGTALEGEDPLSREIPPKVCQTARWILEHASTDVNGHRHWEGVTWDTAVCIRGVLRVAHELPESFSESEHDSIQTICSSGLEWLLARFAIWDSEVIYPYGPADVAQILETLLYVRRDWPQLLAAGNMLGRASDAIDEIAMYLLAAKDEMDIQRGHSQQREELAFWSDFFQSGEVIDCLSQYALQVTEADHRASCEAHVFHCIRYFELHQVNGQWGAHVDTCRALYGYLRATHFIPVARQEDHIVLKALRWMCDSKQRFDDGSFLHTPFVTVFYVAALWEAYAHWPLAQLSVGEAYDVALWSAPVRATEERGLRLALEIERERLLDECQVATGRYDSLRRHVAGSLATIFVAVIGIAIAVVVGLLDVSIKTDDAASALSYFTIVVAVMAGLGGVASRIRDI